MLHWSPLAVLVAGLLSVGPAGIRAQDSTVVCLSSFGWMTNSKSQSPCVVAAYLTVACTGDPTTITPLPADYYYTGPYADEVDTCQCSTVMYSMMSACGLCQNNPIISWKIWAFNCTNLYQEIFPNGIPAGTAVPRWAYQDVTLSGNFNVTLALSLGDNPESTTVAQSTFSIVSTSNSPLPASTSPSILPTGSSTSNTNVGAIAGSVVGGAVGVALIAAVVIFFIVRKRRSQIPPSASISPHSPQMTQPQVYDPSDPSTFPVSLPSPTTMTRSKANVPSSFVTYSSNIPSLRTGTGRAFTSMPEV